MESGYYLTLNLKDKQLQLERDPSDRNKFILHDTTQDGEIYIKSNSVLKIEASHNKLFLKAQVGGDPEENLMGMDDMPMDSSQANQLGASNIKKEDVQQIAGMTSFFRYSVALDRITNDLDCFNFVSPESNYIIETRFLLAIYP